MIKSVSSTCNNCFEINKEYYCRKQNDDCVFVYFVKIILWVDCC